MLSEYLLNTNGLYVQPRMGVGSIFEMREALIQVKSLPFKVIGTITIDSFTRTGHLEEVNRALQAGLHLNGFPILSYSAEQIKDHLAQLGDHQFLIQVRHGTAQPENIFKRMLAAGLYLTEGGPISYCLPYSRLPLAEAVKSWARACHILAEHPSTHLESFGGCLLGQLCHPSILIAVSIIEAVFFQENGLKDISLSYAQQYNIRQDMAAVSALKRLASEFIHSDLRWHIVIYTFMGLFPQTPAGHREILHHSVQLARESGARRLIVKTKDESFAIPSVQSNIDTLIQANAYTNAERLSIKTDKEEEESIYQQAKTIVERVLNLHTNLNEAISKAFEQGIIDIPYCLHPDNKRLARCIVDDNGYIEWLTPGQIPIDKKFLPRLKGTSQPLSSEKFLEMLGFNRHQYDKA